MRPGNGRPPGLQVKTGMYWESSPESPAQASGEAEGPRKGPESSRREWGSCSQWRLGEGARGKGRQQAVPPLSPTMAPRVSAYKAVSQGGSHQVCIPLQRSHLVRREQENDSVFLSPLTYGHDDRMAAPAFF